MRNETFYPAKRLRQGKTIEGVDESLYALEPALYLEAHHRTKTILLARGDTVAGMCFQSRIVNALDGRVSVKRLDHAQRVLAVNTDPGVQRAHSAQREKAVERGAGDSQTVRPPCQLFGKCSIRSDDCPANNVTMSVQVLRGGMDDEIGAELDRSLQCRREKGVVDADQRPRIMSRRHHSRQVGDSQQRIARRLDPQQLGGTRRNDFRRVGRSQIYALDFELAARSERPKNAAAA